MSDEFATLVLFICGYIWTVGWPIAFSGWPKQLWQRIVYILGIAFFFGPMIAHAWIKVVMG